MQCIKCPCYKYDGKEFHCTAYSHADMNTPSRGMFSNEPACLGLRMQRDYLRDRIQNASMHYQRALCRHTCFKNALHVCWEDTVREELKVLLNRAQQECEQWFNKLYELKNQLSEVEAYESVSEKN